MRKPKERWYTLFLGVNMLAGGIILIIVLGLGRDFESIVYTVSGIISAASGGMYIAKSAKTRE